MKKILILLLFLPLFGDSQIITTIAGGATGHGGDWGDGGLATDAQLASTGCIAIDRSGNIYLPCFNRVRKVDPITGVITTIAGTGVAGYNGDGIPATSALLFAPNEVSVDSSGNVYIGCGDFRIKKIDISTGIISTFAGNSLDGDNGDGGLATSASINGGFTAWDNFGNMYLGDSNVIRKVDPMGVITRIAGTGFAGCYGDGIPATNAFFDPLTCVATDIHGDVYVTTFDSCVSVKKINVHTGLVFRVAGTDDNIGIPYSGDGLAATACHIYPFGIALDDTGNLFIADFENQRIEKVDTFGVIHSVTGTGVSGFSGDNGPATAAEINYPEGVAVDKCGNLYIADFNNQRIRKVTFDSTCILSHSTKVITPQPNHQTSLFPNPATSTFTLTSPQPITQITITNLLGQTVYSNNYNKHEIQIDVSTLTTGIYFVKINNAAVRKFIKE